MQSEKLLSKQYGCEAYDYIVELISLRRAGESLRLLKLCHALLKKDGRMLIGREPLCCQVMCVRQRPIY